MRVRVRVRVFYPKTLTHVRVAALIISLELGVRELPMIFRLQLRSTRVWVGGSGQRARSGSKASQVQAARLISFLDDAIRVPHLSSSSPGSLTCFILELSWYLENRNCHWESLGGG